MERGLEAPWEKVADRWRAAYVPNMDRVRRGALEWTILDELHHAALVELLPEFGIASLPESDLRFLTCCWHRLSPWPDAVEGLTSLKDESTLLDRSPTEICPSWSILRNLLNSRGTSFSGPTCSGTTNLTLKRILAFAVTLDCGPNR